MRFGGGAHRSVRFEGGRGGGRRKGQGLGVVGRVVGWFTGDSWPLWWCPNHMFSAQSLHLLPFA